MNDPKADRLDRVLRDWADRQSRDDCNLRGLEERIATSLKQEKFLDLDVTWADPHCRSSSRPAEWFSFVSAAIVLFMIGTLWILTSRDDRPKEAHIVEPLPTFALLEKPQLQAKALLLAEMERLFEGRLTWLAELNGLVQVGLEQDGEPVAATSRPVAMRLVVARRKPTEKDWTAIWSIDVVSRSEQLVRLASESGHDDQVLIWTYVLPDGMIAIDTSLALQLPSPIPSTYSGLQQAGVPTTLCSLRIDDVEFQVVQTVALLDERKDVY